MTWLIDLVKNILHFIRCRCRSSCFGEIDENVKSEN
jgi:hypothetical protein